MLAGRTKGYRHHPQLDRLRASGDPMAAVTAYLDAVHAEATARGFHYDAGRIDGHPRLAGTIPVTSGQVDLEWRHLLAKLASRSPDRLALEQRRTPTLHPLFRLVDGPVEPWERAVTASVGDGGPTPRAE